MNAPRQWIIERLAAFGARPALIADGRTATFDDVVTRIDDWDGRLEAAGVERRVVALIGDCTEDTVGALLALFRRGCVVVPIHASGSARLAETAPLAGAEWVVDTRNRGSLAPLPTPGVHPLVAELRSRDEAGLILLSSGSTGTPKAMLLSLDRLLDRHRRRTRFAPLVTAAFLLFDHIGGFNTLMHAVCTGGTLVQLTSRDPDEVCRRIACDHIELLPVTPTFLNMLLISGAHQRHDLASLRLVTYGTEVMPPSTLRAAVAALPHVTFKQTYGLSEVGILATRSRANDSVWMTIGADSAVKVVDGVLWVKSDAAMLGYLNAPSPFDADGWFCTGDAVDVDGAFIRVHGRQAQMINVGGSKVFPAEVEDELLRAPFVRDAVVWARKNPVTGFIVAATVATAADVDPETARPQILAHCRARLDDYKVPRFLEVVHGPLHGERFKKSAVWNRG